MSEAGEWRLQACLRRQLALVVGVAFMYAAYNCHTQKLGRGFLLVPAEPIDQTRT